MLLFDQQTFSDPERRTYGDCVRACVYTLAQVDLCLPHPIDPKTGEWNSFFWDDLHWKGYQLSIYPRYRVEFGRYTGKSGISVRGHRHLVIFDNEENKVLHDPHPSRSGLISMEGSSWVLSSLTM